MEIKISPPCIDFGTHQRVLNVKCASATMGAMTKKNPRSSTLPETKQLFDDLETLETALHDLVKSLNDAEAALMGEPYGNTNDSIVVACSQLHNEVAVAKKLSPSIRMPDLDETADVISTLKSMYAFEIDSLNKKKGTIKSRIRNSFIRSIAASKDLSFLNTASGWHKFLPRGSVSKELYGATFTAVDVEKAVKAPVGSILRNTAVLHSQCKQYVNALEIAKQKKIDKAKADTRLKRLNEISKDLEGKLNNG